jgi:moderate conductance mechanosensitive channel
MACWMGFLTENFSVDALRLLAAGLMVRAVRVAVTLAAAMIASRLIRRFTPRFRRILLQVMQDRAAGSSQELEKRAATIAGMAGKTAVAAIWALAIVMSLGEFGFAVGPILAGAGIVGLAAGFGARNLVRDVISGLFMLMENQVRVGDVAIVNSQAGLVEEIHLRTIVLRSVDGAVHVFRNGAITTLSNVTLGFSCFVFDIGVAYKEDPDRVIELLKQVGGELMQDEAFGREMLEPVEIFGVDKFTGEAMVIKGRIKTKAGKHRPVGREFNRRVRKRFDDLGVEIPFPHRSVHFGGSGKPFHIGLEDASCEGIKNAS